MNLIVHFSTRFFLSVLWNIKMYKIMSFDQFILKEQYQKVKGLGDRLELMKLQINRINQKKTHKTRIKPQIYA